MGFTKTFELPRKFFLVSVKEVVRKQKLILSFDHLCSLQLAQWRKPKRPEPQSCLPEPAGLLGRSHQWFRVHLDYNKGLGAYFGEKFRKSPLFWVGGMNQSVQVCIQFEITEELYTHATSLAFYKSSCHFDSNIMTATLRLINASDI